MSRRENTVTVFCLTVLPLCERRDFGSICEQEIQFGALQRLTCCFVGVLMPIVDDQTMCVIDIEPAGFNENVDQLAFLSVPLHPAFNGQIGIFADVALGRISASEVPHTLEIAKHDRFGQFQKRLQVCELWVVWYGPECHRFRGSRSFCKIQPCVSTGAADLVDDRPVVPRALVVAREKLVMKQIPVHLNS